MLRADISPEASKFISGLDFKRQSQILRKIDQLCANPTSGDTRALVGFDFNRTRCEEYRIISRVKSGELQIALIGRRHDNEVYHELKKLME